MTRRSLALALLAVAASTSLGAQETRTVAPGPEYRAGPVRQFLLGRTWRELWTDSVRVPVLDLSRYAGGLTPTERGGGNQTVSLRFRGADGQEYAFRSVNKRQWRAQEPELRGTVVGDVLQDQVSSQQPTGLIAAGRLMDATGALHVDPELFVMPDDPRLGEFRQEFAGMLGTVELRPDAPWMGAEETEGGEDFPEELEKDPRNRVADEEYLTVRLLDIVMNDWDRHADQYRWAGFDTLGVRLWRPIPRDRDYVFVDYDGFLVGLGRPFLDKAVSFGPEPDVFGLVEQGIELDRRLLGELSRADWDSVQAALRARLTDALIADAVRELPAEHCAIVCATVEQRLRQRRDALPRVVNEFYALMATEPELHGSDGDETAVVERMGDSLRVRVHTGGEGGPVSFDRTFAANETREVRLWMHGGDDVAVVRGQGAILVRVLGGNGQDRFEDRGRGARTVFYDEGDASQVQAGANTVVDRRDWEPLGYPTREGVDPPRDWGASSSMFAPYAAIRPYADLVIGAGPKDTRYGFRRYPWATQWWARGLWAPMYGRLGAEFFAGRRWTGSAVMGGVFARASELEATAFHGYGNDRALMDGLGRRDYIVWERQYLVEPTLVIPVSERLTFTAAGVARWTDPEIRDDTPAAMLGRGDDAAFPDGGVEPFLALGARAGMWMDGRDDMTYPRGGFTLLADAAGFPGLGTGDEDVGAFTRGRAIGTGYLSLGGPVLAVRAGAETALGEYPLQYASFLGGSPTLRGYTLQRFAGDHAAFGSAEVRTVLTKANLLVRGDLGVLGLVDAGRVWYDGESEGGWHTAVGAGAFFRFRQQAVTVLYARGDEDFIYLRLGLPF